MSKKVGYLYLSYLVNSGVIWESCVVNFRK